MPPLHQRDVLALELQLVAAGQGHHQRAVLRGDGLRRGALQADEVGQAVGVDVDVAQVDDAAGRTPWHQVDQRQLAALALERTAQRAARGLLRARRGRAGQAARARASGAGRVMGMVVDERIAGLARRESTSRSPASTAAMARSRRISARLAAAAGVASGRERAGQQDVAVDVADVAVAAERHRDVELLAR